eukprot:403332537
MELWIQTAVNKTLNPKIMTIGVIGIIDFSAKKWTVKETKIQSSTIMNRLHDQVNEFKNLFTQSENHKRLQVEAHIRTLEMLEEKVRREKRVLLNEQSIRLGRLSTQRSGTKYVEIWEDGEAFKKINTKLSQIQREKEEIEKLKKSKTINSRRAQKKNGKDLPLVPIDGFSSNSGRQSGISQINEPSEYDLEQSEFNNIDKNEQKEIYQFKLKLLENEERRAREELHQLEKEKVIYLNEFKRVAILKSIKHLILSNVEKSLVKYIILTRHGMKLLRKVTSSMHFEKMRFTKISTTEEQCANLIQQKLITIVFAQYWNYVLKQKIIHYDLKPQNIVFHNGEVKITDFGLCKSLEENQDKIELTSQGVGTYWYQAPECFINNGRPVHIDSKVDVWSVGVIFFELLFGQKPFGHDKSQQAILQDQTILNSREVVFPLRPTISDSCKDFIRKCLAYHQEDRYDVYEAYYSPYLKGQSFSNLQAQQSPYQQIMQFQQSQQSNQAKQVHQQFILQQQQMTGGQKQSFDLNQ